MALSDVKVRSAKPEAKACKLTDGKGMVLLVHPNGSKYWRLRYRFGGKEKMLALGRYPEISLADARARRDEARKLLANGVDPSENKKAAKVEQELEVAARLQQRTTAIRRFAVQTSLIDYNPAQEIAGAVATAKRQHRVALELNRIPELLHHIDHYSGRPLTRLAVELTLLVFIRSSELRFARWSEVDFETAIWTIPGEHEPLEGVKHSQRGSKMRTPHLVPLSRQALVILEKIKSMSGNRELIFVGDHDPRKPMSENTVNKALRVMGYDTKTEVCGHGFRTMACSSLIESGLWSRDAVERQMSHQERSSVRAAYIHKAEHLGERRLMLQWRTDYLDANMQKVISPFDYAEINDPLR
ncbi:tyrosine-type recombinase/integrase [[Erwinia] mediterraneensis]|uniref:tyrosine-type recombinase/integrase n=1 Tax=[Erwinia] mediterraneensis TaxID=2161819 RepID=UPI00102FFAB7|nr:integrase arm-type DNA-binding domain-containing protein [[Erwinia] mediterraneensis]